MSNKTIETKDKILLGYVSSAHGIKGEVKVKSTYNLNDFISFSLKRLLVDYKGALNFFEIEKQRPSNEHILIKFKNITTRNESELLKGAQVFALREDLSLLEEGSFYFEDILGLKVITTKGLELGAITDLLETGANDVYVVTSGKKEYLIPDIKEVIKEINLEKQIMTIEPLEGLLELTDSNSNSNSDKNKK